nr:GDSL-type esterase/lipase family protein [Collinsella tanakaei]
MAGVASRGYRVELVVTSREQEARSWVAVVNDAPAARFEVPSGKRVRVRFEVQLTCRGFELALEPEGDFDDGCAPDAAIELDELVLEVIERAGRRKAPTIWIAADSTVQTYFDEERPQAGWGEWLYWYLYRDHRAQVRHDEGSATVQARRFDGCGPTIRNRALGARSARSYIAEGRLAALLAQVRPGDILLIQFGLNDASATRPMRYIAPEQFRCWLARFVESARDRGVRPVLITPPPQYRAPGADAPASPFDTYAAIARAYAAEADVPLIDLRALATAYLEGLPPENRAAFFLRAPVRQWASHPDGIKDNVHLSVFGAFTCAGIIARELVRLVDGLELVGDERTGAPAAPCDVRACAQRGIVGLEAEVRWRDANDADYWTVEKRSAETGRLYERFVVLQPRLHDLPLPGQSRHVRYEVRAWRGAESSAPVEVALTLAASDDACPRVEAELLD